MREGSALRSAEAKDYEIVKNAMPLSGPKYYAKFEEACLNFVTRYGL